jgi:MFS family permease
MSIVARPSSLHTLLNQTFAALKYYNYRLWFSGQLVSLFGTWMQSTAQGYLVFQLTGSPAYLGYVGFAAGLPSWLFMLYGGVAADRMSRRNLLLLTQTAMMILAFILAALTFTRLVQPWHIILLAFLLGTANAFDAPARMAFVRELVDRADMTNAIALNATMFNMGTVLGPAMAGLTYALYGPAWCFTINGLTFFAVITALLFMRIRPALSAAHLNSALSDIQAGFRYVAGHPTIRILILNLGLVSLFGLGFITLMPAWAVTVLGGDATTNGYLFSARGLGALTGALMIAALGRIKFKGKLLTLGSFTMPAILLLFSLTRWLPLSMLALVGVGWGFMVMANMSNALVQTHVPDELRGRVMGIYTLTFFGFMPIGSLLNGALAARIGAPVTILANSLLLLAFAAVIWLRFPNLRALE